MEEKSKDLSVERKIGKTRLLGREKALTSLLEKLVFVFICC